MYPSRSFYSPAGVSENGSPARLVRTSAKKIMDFTGALVNMRPTRGHGALVSGTWVSSVIAIGFQFREEGHGMPERAKSLVLYVFLRSLSAERTVLRVSPVPPQEAPASRLLFPAGGGSDLRPIVRTLCTVSAGEKGLIFLTVGVIYSLEALHDLFDESPGRSSWARFPEHNPQSP